MEKEYIQIEMNPFYDYVTGYREIIVPSSSPRIKTAKDNSNIILRKKISNSVKEFENTIKTITPEIPKAEFPLECAVLVVVEIQYHHKKDFISKDTDNITKSTKNSKYKNKRNICLFQKIGGWNFNPIFWVFRFF